MDFKDIVYAYFFACRAFICREKNELSLHRVKLPHLPCVFLIRAAILFCVRHEVNHCYHGVISILYRVVDQIQFLVQQSHLAFRQFDFLIRPSAGFRDHAVEACERREGRKLCRAVMHAHVRTVCRLVVRERQDIGVGILFMHHSSPALWPPIWPFRAMVVPPSIRFIHRFIGKEVLSKVLPRELLKEDTSILVNPSGKFALGGPAADTGLTGRKLAVDQYGPVAHIGGGALSGKDPTKVDRSGAYAARWVAKNIVAAGMAKRCEVQIAYAIGRSEPVSLTVDTFGTGVIPDSRIEAAVKAVFDLTPAGIIRDLKLNRPIYSKLSCYGHYGRTELELPWEEINRKYELLSAALKQSVRQ